MFETVEIKDVKAQIGQLVKHIRKRKKLSQAQLAASLDVSRATIQNLEMGNNFTIDTLLKVIKEVDLLDQLNKEITQAKEQLTEPKSLY